MNRSSDNARRGLAVGRWTLAAWLGGVALLSLQCATTTTTAEAAARQHAMTAFHIVYEVLQHPRCRNCHPAGRVPLQGDAGQPHGQNVQGGDDGQGRFALRCSNCHRDENTPGEGQPPGAKGWHLPPAAMPLVFEGRSPAQLARQLGDPTQNGNRTPEQVLDHLRHDPLVLWGWNPGEGRAPVPIPHATFVAAMRTWIEGGCPVPE